jgi:lysozyme
MNVLTALIRRFEGLRLRAYLCPAGVWTCGYGSTGPDVTRDTVWTVKQAEERMQQDALKFLVATRNLCPQLTGEPQEAIADFAYNLGTTRLAGSTLRRKLNAGDLPGARRELSKWVRGGGRVLPGLIVRRASEAQYLR